MARIRQTFNLSAGLSTLESDDTVSDFSSFKRALSMTRNCLDQEAQHYEDPILKNERMQIENGSMKLVRVYRAFSRQSIIGPNARNARNAINAINSLIYTVDDYSRINTYYGNTNYIISNYMTGSWTNTECDE